MCRAPSAATAARLAARGSSASTSAATSDSTARRSSGNSLLHRRVASRASASGATSASAAVSSSCDSCEGYLRLKKRSALTWSTRFAVLRGAELYVFYSKQDASLRRNLVESLTIASGRIAPRADLSLELLTADKRELQARVFSRGDLARWVTAFHRLAVRREAAEAASAATGAATPAKRLCVDAAGSVGSRQAEQPERELREQSAQPDASGGRRSDRSSAFEASEPSQQQQEEEQEEEHNPVVMTARSSGVAGSDGSDSQQPSARRRVSFNGSVTVRLIPALEQAQVSELFYSKKEVERFSAQATSLLSRTEEAVSCACLALRRGPTTLLPWRRQAV